MDEPQNDTLTRPVPIWYWVVSVLSLIWAGFGLMDCFMSLRLDEEYLANYPGYQAFVLAMPISVKIAWVIATLGSTFGTICLLLRRQWAVWCFGLAILGMAVSFAYQTLSPNRPELSAGMSLMSFLIVGIGLSWFYFSRKWADKGWLR